jgi:Carboxypeptidase regulatory-like domain
VAEFSGGGIRDSDRGRADGWNEVMGRWYAPIRVRLSTRTAALKGRVTGSGDEPVPGAPVYLEAFDSQTGKRLTDLRTARTDFEGRYRFAGLAPGVYRVLSTFEYDQPDSQTMGAAGASVVTLSEGGDNAQDLELYVR